MGIVENGKNKTETLCREVVKNNGTDPIALDLSMVWLPLR